MSQNITIVKVVGSKFDPQTNLFKREVIGADGFGYRFVRPVEVDRQNLPTEQAILHDLVEWMAAAPRRVRSVVAFAPRYDPARPVEWLPEIRVARPTRYYWRPDLQQVHTRVKCENDETYNLFTPLGLVRELISAYRCYEAKVRERAYGQHPEDLLSSIDWLSKDSSTH